MGQLETITGPMRDRICHFIIFPMHLIILEF